MEESTFVEMYEKVEGVGVSGMKMEGKEEYGFYVLVFVVMLLLSFFVVKTSTGLVEEDFLKTGERRPNVILITLESTRADHLPCYGYHRNTTPNICKLAEDGVLFEQAYSQGTETKISMPVIMTGQLPSSVAFRRWNETLTEQKIFPEVLQDSNYTVRGEFDSLLRSIKEEFFLGIQKRADETDYLPLESDKFIYLNHFYELAHSPFSPAERHRKWDSVGYDTSELSNMTTEKQLELLENEELSKENLRDLYDEELREGDEKVGEIITRLKEANLYDDTLIIVTTDHGSALGERGRLLHSGPPYEELIHVPLVIKFPQGRWPGKEIKSPVRLMDLAPTIYDYLGLDKVPETAGKSLIPLIEEGNDKRPIMSAGYSTEPNEPHEEIWSLKKNEYKYLLFGVEDTCVRGREPAHQELYNLERDKKESENIVDENLKKVEELRNELCDIYLKGLERKYETEGIELSEEQKERLKRLGYLD